MTPELQRPEGYTPDVTVESSDNFQIERFTGKAAEADYVEFIKPVKDLRTMIGKYIPPTKKDEIRKAISVLSDRYASGNINVKEIEGILVKISNNAGFNLAESVMTYLDSPARGRKI